MATLYISEFTSTSVDHGRGGSAAYQPASFEQTITPIDGTPRQSSAFNAVTRMVRLHTDAICSIKFGTNPTAATTNARMAAGQTEYFQVPETGTYKVSVIANT